MANVIVDIKDVNKIYGTNHVVKDLNLQVEEGEFLTLLGSSGCGKTTTLRMIAGFEEPTTGSIQVEGEPIEDKEPFERNVNTVFQSYALFPHKTIYDNVAYGLKMKKVPKKEIKERVTEMLEMVQLSGFEKRYPSQLSGGQKQRVAIARALINRPKVLLLDEPLGALDLKLRKQMQLELKRLQKKLHITFIYVTHDQEEALTMSDRIAIINQGVLEQIDTPINIYQHPKTKFVAGFIGESNILDAIVLEDHDHKAVIGMEVGRGTVEDPDDSLAVNDPVSVSVRPENMLFSETPIEGFNLKGVVKEHIYVGNIIKMMITLNDGTEIKVNRFRSEDLADIGKMVYLYWELDKGVVIKEKHLVNTDAVRDIEGGVADDEDE